MYAWARSLHHHHHHHQHQTKGFEKNIISYKISCSQKKIFSKWEERKRRGEWLKENVCRLWNWNESIIKLILRFKEGIYSWYSALLFFGAKRKWQKKRISAIKAIQLWLVIFAPFSLYCHFYYCVLWPAILLLMIHIIPQRPYTKFMEIQKSSSNPQSFIPRQQNV